MKSPDGSYKHYIPKLNLSIERNTERVPNNGKYYIVFEGRIIGSSRSVKKTRREGR